NAGRSPPNNITLTNNTAMNLECFMIYSFFLENENLEDKSIIESIPPLKSINTQLIVRDYMYV
ncbi:MAG: hypothetical protein IJQ58_06620, partial [Synergistaceae bacterium]|nr:hypothetical protein [Synergistaceae bacterium]